MPGNAEGAQADQHRRRRRRRRGRRSTTGPTYVTSGRGRAPPGRATGSEATRRQPRRPPASAAGCSRLQPHARAPSGPSATAAEVGVVEVLERRRTACPASRSASITPNSRQSTTTTSAGRPASASSDVAPEPAVAEVADQGERASCRRAPRTAGRAGTARRRSRRPRGTARWPAWPTKRTRWPRRAQLGGDAEGGRHVAAAVPGDEEDLGHGGLLQWSGSVPSGRGARHQAVHAAFGAVAAEAAVAAQQLPGVDVGRDDEQVDELLGVVGSARTARRPPGPRSRCIALPCSVTAGHRSWWPPGPASAAPASPRRS